MRYSEGTMSSNYYQITIRGLDARTKQLLAKKAAEKGLSLNKLGLESLRRTAGTEDNNERYARIRAFLEKHPMPRDEAERIDEALRWHKQASLAKQKRDGNK